MVRELPHDYYERPGEPELHAIGNTANYLEAEPDFGAGGHKRAVPFLSAIGRGPMGEGVYPVIEQDDDGNFVFTLVSDVTGEVVMRSGNLSAGEMYITSPEHEVVPGENSYFTIHIKRNDDIKSYMLTIPPGAEGSRIYLTKRLMDYDSGGVYIFDIGDLYYDGQNGWPSKPFPRPNDTIIFTTKKANGEASLCFGHIEQAAGTQVVATGLSYIDAVIPLIGENGNWFVNGVDTGHRAIGVDGVSPILAGFEPNVINVDPATGELPDDPNSISIFSYTWDGQAITCVHELYLVDLDGVISDVIATSPETSRWILNLHEILDGYDLREYSGLRCRSTESNPWENDYPRVTFNTCAFTVDPEIVVKGEYLGDYYTPSASATLALFGVLPTYPSPGDIVSITRSAASTTIQVATTARFYINDDDGITQETFPIKQFSPAFNISNSATVWFVFDEDLNLVPHTESQMNHLSSGNKAGLVKQDGSTTRVNAAGALSVIDGVFATPADVADAVANAEDVTSFDYYVNAMDAIVIDEDFNVLTPLSSAGSDAFTFAASMRKRGQATVTNVAFPANTIINFSIACVRNSTGERIVYNVPTTNGGAGSLQVFTVAADTIKDMFKRIYDEDAVPYQATILGSASNEGPVPPKAIPITIRSSSSSSEDSGAVRNDNNRKAITGSTLNSLLTPGSYFYTEEQSNTLGLPDEAQGYPGIIEVINSRGTNSGTTIRHISQVIAPDAGAASGAWNLYVRQGNYEVGGVTPPSWSETYTLRQTGPSTSDPMFLGIFKYAGSSSNSLNISGGFAPRTPVPGDYFFIENRTTSTASSSTAINMPIGPNYDITSYRTTAPSFGSGTRILCYFAEDETIVSGPAEYITAGSGASPLGIIEGQPVRSSERIGLLNTLAAGSSQIIPLSLEKTYDGVAVFNATLRFTDVANTVGSANLDKIGVVVQYDINDPSNAPSLYVYNNSNDDLGIGDLFIDVTVSEGGVL